MIARKFSLIISSMISLFLFILGVTMLSYLINVDNSSNRGFGNIFDLDEHKPKTEPFNTLLLVGDKEEYNTDTMMLINYDPEQATINVLSLPRDTRVKFKGYNIPKLNSVYSTCGIKKTCETVSNLLDVNIKYYVYINLSTFRQIIDTLGGVDYYVPVDLDYDDPTQNLHIHIKKGMHHMDGKMAEEFLRFRHPNGRYSQELMKYYDGSDIKRTDMQLSFLKELVKQKAKLYNITKINSVLNVILKNVKTNITLSEVLDLAPSVSNLKASKIKTYRLDGQDGIVNDIWYFLYNGNILDLSTMQSRKAETIIQRYFKSEPGISQSTIGDAERIDMYKYTVTDPTPIKPSPIMNSAPSPSPLPSSKPSSSEDRDKDGWDWDDNPSNDETSVKPNPSGEG